MLTQAYAKNASAWAIMLSAFQAFVSPLSSDEIVGSFGSSFRISSLGSD